MWAYRTSKRGPTDTTPYALMYGHDAVLPLEINIASLRVQEQHLQLLEQITLILKLHKKLKLQKGLQMPTELLRVLLKH